MFKHQNREIKSGNNKFKKILLDNKMRKINNKFY